ncbi:Uncharacterised protein [Mycobacteroides abscessus]|nr:Uncharacterised protein [Mycobacteroides abscessus]
MSTSVPCAPSTVSSPWARSWRTTARHSFSERSSPTPNTDSSWCRNRRTFSVSRPRRMSTTCPTPKRCPRSRSRRNTVESTFCAATVPSQASGGARHVSHVPQAPGCSWPK